MFLKYYLIFNTKFNEKSKQKNFADVLKCNDDFAIDLIKKMIVFNPEKRLSIEECLNHQYITSIKDDTIIDPIFTGLLNFDFETVENIEIEFLIGLLEKEISSFDTGAHNFN